MTGKTDEVVFATASAQLSALEAGELSSRELLDAYLERIAEHPWVNAVVTVDAERARAQAVAADRRRRAGEAGEAAGCLHGLPITIKHDVEVAGMASTYGAAVTRDHVPANDATAVARLRRAGAIIFGRTNLPEYARDGQSYNELHGVTANPWNPARTPGGSSGGAAAALAAGMTSLELGSDLGGSIRLPASWCGVLGHKPTWAIVPGDGRVPVPGEPDGADLYPSAIGVAGPLARSARDLDLALTVLTGASERQSGWKPALPPPPFRGHRELRAAIWLGDDEQPVQAHTLAMLQDACRALAADGVTVDERRRPPLSLDGFQELFELLFSSELPVRLGEEVYGRVVEATRELGGHAPLAELHLRGLGLSHREWLALERDRLRLARAWEEFFDEVDVLLCPAVARTAIKHDHSLPVELRTTQVDGDRRWLRPGLTRWAAPASVSRLPATVAPVGLAADGLPVGIQIVGPAFADRSTIAAARLLEQTVGGFRPPPRLTRSAPRDDNVPSEPTQAPGAIVPDR